MKLVPSTISHPNSTYKPILNLLKQHFGTSLDQKKNQNGVNIQDGDFTFSHLTKTKCNRSFKAVVLAKKRSLNENYKGQMPLSEQKIYLKKKS
jgi:hypothetical protein